MSLGRIGYRCEVSYMYADMFMWTHAQVLRRVNLCQHRELGRYFRVRRAGLLSRRDERLRNMPCFFRLRMYSRLLLP